MIEYKVEKGLEDFPAWQGGKQRLKEIIDADRVEEFEGIIQDLYADETPTETEINDFLWFTADEYLEQEQQELDQSKQQPLNQSSLSRTLKHISGDTAFALLTGFRNEFAPKQNLERNGKLGKKIRELGFGYFIVDGKFVQDKGQESQKEVSEDSFFVVGPKLSDVEAVEKFKNDIVALGKAYNQDSVIVKTADGVNAYDKSGVVVLGFKNAPRVITNKDVETYLTSLRGGGEKAFTLQVKEDNITGQGEQQSSTEMKKQQLKQQQLAKLKQQRLQGGQQKKTSLSQQQKKTPLTQQQRLQKIQEKKQQRLQQQKQKPQVGSIQKLRQQRKEKLQQAAQQRKSGGSAQQRLSQKLNQGSTINKSAYQRFLKSK